VFDHLSEVFKQGKIVVLDEFQNLSEVRGAVTLLQRYWDEEFSKTNAVVSSFGVWRFI
jgi:hypothetical protein